MGDGMMGFLARVFRRLALAGVAFAICVTVLFAQAPTGPQSGGQPQTTPPPGQTPTPPKQKPPEAGLSIAVEVPVVTMDVVATTSHGDIITGKLVVEPGAIFNGTCKMGTVKDIKLSDSGNGMKPQQQEARMN